MAIRVMLVDDDADEATILEGLIDNAETEFDFSAVQDFESGLAAMLDGVADVYLVDYRLGSKNGLDLMMAAKDQGCTDPMLLVTGFGDHDVDVAAENAGAAGYLVKGEFDASLLERSIRYSLSNWPGQRRPSRPGDLQLQVALAKGATVREAARIAGVSERTAHRRNGDPEFLAEVERIRDELRDRLLNEVVQQMVNEDSSKAS